MNLAGQADNRRRGEQGYAMAALLIAMAVMAIMMTVAMPVWRQMAQREKEEELVFRGMQYVHAIGLFQRKFANAYPPNLDTLVDQRFLRKKFKDPITNDDFVIIPVGASLPGAPGQPGGQRGGAAAGGNSRTTGAAGQTGATGQTSAPGTSAQQPSGSQPSSQGGLAPIGTRPGGIGGGASAGVAGVTSKSKDQSIRLYNGRSHYNEWAFVYTPQLQAGQTAPGAGGPGRGQPGPQGPGGLPGGRGGRGQPGTDPSGRGRGNNPQNPFGPGQNPFGPNNPGRGFGPGAPAQPIFGPTPRGRE